MTSELPPSDDTREQLGSLISYLRDLHALRNPPIRNIADHGALRLDPQRSNGLPGVSLQPGGDVWLTADLLVPPTEPDLPGHLLELAVPRLVAGDRPVPRADTDEVGRTRLEQWNAAEWDTWKQRYDDVERSRRFYLELFSARDQIEADGAGLELVWGFGPVRWREHGVDHPLFTVRLEIEYLADVARLELRPSRPLRAETEVLTGLPLVAQRQLFDAMVEIEESENDPWQREFEPDVLAPLLLMMSHSPPADGGPSLRTGEWVIFARRKPSGYLSFVRGLESQLDSLASLPTLASLVASDPRRFDVGDSPPEGRSSAATSEVLLPLPANDEQREILRHSSSAPGVTVEGPPGTGKSHTIANLISGFIADGKRVLVTAERAQALEVLLDKIPEPLQPLCVPVLGVGQEERIRLEHAIDRISQAAFGIDTHRAEAAALPVTLDETARSIAAIRNQLREVRRVEAQPVPDFVPPNSRASRAAAAAWLHEHEDRYSFVPDALDADCQLSWSSNERQVVIDTLQAVAAEDLRLSRDVRPAIPLPPGEDLSREDYERGAWLEVAHRSREVEIGTAVESEEPLAGLRDQLAMAADEVEAWETGALHTAFEQLQSGPQQQLWRAFAQELSTAVHDAYSRRESLQAHQVEIPGDEPFGPEVLDVLGAALDALEKGGRLGFSHRRARQMLETCHVDGRTPSTAADLVLVRAASELRARRRVIRNLLRSKSDVIGKAVGSDEIREDDGAPISVDLNAMVDWLDVRWPTMRASLAKVGVRSAPVADAAALRALHDAVDSRLAASRVALLDDRRSVLMEHIHSRVQTSTAREIWNSLAVSLESCDWAAWDAARFEIERLSKLQDAAEVIHGLLDSLAEQAPGWAEHLRATGDLPAANGADLEQAWTWRKVETWFASTQVVVDSEELEGELRRLERVQQALVGQLAAARAWLAVTGRIDGPTQVALAAYKTVNARLGKGYSKFKGTYQKQLEEALEGCRHVIPAWVMPVERVLTDFPCGPEPLFDVLIIDEASQLPMTRLPILALARKVIVVGDDKQISPSSPGLEIQPSLDAMKSRLDGIANAGATYFVGASVYDVAVQRFPRKVLLREHFRCLTPIIEFSNARYYDGRLIPLRDRMPTPDWKPLHSVLVSDGYRDGDDCNRPEAERIATLIAELVQHTEYATRSIGVITLLGRNQAKLIYDLVFEALGPAKMAAHSVRIGDAATFQGDERDVVFLSTVVSDSGGRSIGAMTGKPHQQMVNVAASRARDQLWIVHSVGPDAFPTGDERAALIRHCSAATDVSQAYEDLVGRTDEQSPFERDLLRHLIARGYRTIRPQHKVGRYRIDFVIDGPSSRLAIECDGDRFHGPDQWEADRARQSVLERTGWTFVRIRGSAFYRDPAKALEPLWAKLDELGIPAFDWTTNSPAMPAALPSSDRSLPPGHTHNPQPPTAAPSVDTNGPDNDRPRPEAVNSTFELEQPLAAAEPEPLANVDPWAAAFRAADRRLQDEQTKRQT